MQHYVHYKEYHKSARPQDYLQCQTRKAVYADDAEDKVGKVSQKSALDEQEIPLPVLALQRLNNPSLTSYSERIELSSPKLTSLARICLSILR